MSNNSKCISVRMTEEKWRLLRAHLAVRGITFQEFIGKVLDREISKNVEEDIEVIKTLANTFT